MAILADLLKKIKQTPSQRDFSIYLMILRKQIQNALR